MLTTEQLKSLSQRDFDVKGTIQLLKSNQPIFWSWGVSKIAFFENLGILMKVSGHHHKGYVYVSLSWNDTYMVHIISYRGVLKQTFENVYFDQLVEIIDNRIEKIKDYKF